MATREDDGTFSSFVNCVELATNYAQENISKSSKGKSTVLPFIPLFGGEFKWVAYSGRYDKLYGKHFGNVSEEDRGGRYLNE